MPEPRNIREEIEKGIFPRLICPGLLVQVLPKPNSFGLLYLPETHRNSVNREAIVLATYEPRAMNFMGKELLFTPSVKVGDHVLIPHWSGVPADGVSDTEDFPYRVIKDRIPWTLLTRESGEPFAILEPEPTDLASLVDTALERVMPPHGQWPFDADELLSELQRDFHLIPKKQSASFQSADPHRHD